MVAACALQQCEVRVLYKMAWLNVLGCLSLANAHGVTHSSTFGSGLSKSLMPSWLHIVKPSVFANPQPAAGPLPHLLCPI